MMKSLEFVLNGLDSLIESKEHHIGQKHSHVVTHEDTLDGVNFKDASRRRAGKTTWAKIKANPYKWIKDHEKGTISLYIIIYSDSCESRYNT